MPGPGAYEPKANKNQGVIFTHDKRSKEKISETPGPGAYKVPVKIADVPKYLIPKQEEAFKFV